MINTIGHDAIERKGLWKSHRFLWLRRISQLSVITLFMLGPITGIWLIQGNLSSSLLLDTVPLSDPLVWLQSLAAGHAPEWTLGLGALWVVLFYLLVGGRVFCSWVCPVNMVTDSANWLRLKLGLNKSGRLSRKLRFWMLGIILLAPLFTGMILWELINPVSLMMRGLVFGMGAGWLILAAIFALDLLMIKHGWCGHLCPVGAFYTLLGRFSLVKVDAKARSRCNDCMDCYAVCPEPQIIKPALKGELKNIPSIIIAPECTNCGRCIDVCAESVFEFSTRFANKAERQS